MIHVEMVDTRINRELRHVSTRDKIEAANKYVLA